MNRRGSRILIFSSFVTSLEDLFDPFSEILSVGSGGGDRLLPFLPGGVIDLPDFREPRETLRERVRRGASMGVGKDTGPVDSSSVSHAAMVSQWVLVSWWQTKCAAVLRHSETSGHFHVVGGRDSDSIFGGR